MCLNNSSEERDLLLTRRLFTVVDNLKLQESKRAKRREVEVDVKTVFFLLLLVNQFNQAMLNVLHILIFNYVHILHLFVCFLLYNK